MGEQAFPYLKSISDEVDIVQVFGPSDETPIIVQEAVKLKPKLIWLQLTIKSEEAKMIAIKNEIGAITNSSYFNKSSLFGPIQAKPSNPGPK